MNYCVHNQLGISAWHCMVTDTPPEFCSAFFPVARLLYSPQGKTETRKQIHKNIGGKNILSLQLTEFICCYLDSDDAELSGIYSSHNPFTSSQHNMPLQASQKAAAYRQPEAQEI